MTNGETGPAFGASNFDAAAMDGVHPAAEPAAAQAITGAQLVSLAEGIGSILQRTVHEFLQWGEQFMTWANAQQMNGFQVPEPAYAEYRGRLAWLIGFIEPFTQATAILAAAGQGQPAALLGDYLNGLRGLQAKFDATTSAMQADDFATGQNIRNIGRQMFDTNVQAANTRLGIQRAGDAATAAINNVTHQNQQNAADAQFARMMGLLRS